MNILPLKGPLSNLEHIFPSKPHIFQAMLLSFEFEFSHLNDIYQSEHTFDDVGE